MDYQLEKLSSKDKLKATLKDWQQMYDNIDKEVGSCEYLEIAGRTTHYFWCNKKEKSVDPWVECRECESLKPIGGE